MLPIDEADRRAAERCRLIGDVLFRIGDRWSVIVVMVLADRPRRFGELKRTLEDVSSRMLTLTLRRLERDGVVDRIVTPGNASQVTYRLSALGRSVHAPIYELGEWAIRHRADVTEARDGYDRRTLAG